MANDDPSDPAHRPPSTRRLFSFPADSRKVDAAQQRIMNVLRTGVVNLVNRYFDEAGDVIRRWILHATIDMYNDGIARGRTQAVLFYSGYLDVLDRKYADAARDPRRELARPVVTCLELHAALLARQASLTLQETEKLAIDLRISLAPPDDDG